MDKTFRQPLQTKQGLTENLNLSYEYPMITVASQLGYKPIQNLVICTANTCLLNRQDFQNLQTTGTYVVSREEADLGWQLAVGVVSHDSKNQMTPFQLLDKVS